MLLFTPRIHTCTSASLLLVSLILLGSIVTTSSQYRPKYYPNDNEDEEFWGDSNDMEDSESDEEDDWPEPSSTVDFSTTNLDPLEVSPLRWKDSGRIVSPYAFRGGLPPQLTKTMQDYCERMGITQAFRNVLIEGKPYPPDTRRPIQFNGFNWYLWRPDFRWKSNNMHWIGTQDEAAYRDLLIALGSGGFDSVLEAVGRTFRMDGISAYHVGFMAVSHGDEGYVHADFTETGGKGVHVIFPIVTSTGNDPDLQIFAPDRTEGVADEKGKDGAAFDEETEGRRWPPPPPRLRIRAGGYRYENGTALMIGDDVDHGTAPLDYRDRGEMRMCISIYMADINEENAESIADEYSTTGLPEGEPEWLLAQAGKHWSATDKSRRLPRAGDDDNDAKPAACRDGATVEDKKVEPPVLASETA